MRDRRVVAFDLFGTDRVEPRGLRHDRERGSSEEPREEGPLFTVGIATGIIRPLFFSLYAG